MWSHQLVLFDFGMAETHTGSAKGALPPEWIMCYSPSVGNGFVESF